MDLSHLMYLIYKGLFLELLLHLNQLLSSHTPTCLDYYSNTQHTLMQCNQDSSMYCKEIKEYKRLRDNLDQVEAHITKTIHQDLLYRIEENQLYTIRSRRFQGFTLPHQPTRNITCKRST